MWLLKILSGKTQLSAFHSSSVTPPKAPQVDQPAMLTTNSWHLKIRSPTYTRVKLLHGANDILVIMSCFFFNDDIWSWLKRLSYCELQSNFGCGKVRNFHLLLLLRFAIFKSLWLWTLYSSFQPHKLWRYGIMRTWRCEFLRLFWGG